MYKVFIYISLFLIYSFVGWILEVIITFPKYKKFVNRGFLIGPVVPIYGFGALLITILLTKYKEDALTLFCMAMIICSLLEYLTSYIMEKLFKARWWDYSNKKFNLNGRICLQNIALFGIGALLMIYLANPLILGMLEKINPMLLKSVVSILSILFLIDLSISTKIIYNFKGIGLSTLKDSTEEINKKVKEAIMNKGVLTRRVAKAFPNFRFSDSFLKNKKS